MALSLPVSVRLDLMRDEIAALTGLRGVAACWVMIYHLHLDDTTTGPLMVLLKHGYLAVDLFFVLSGFVMALTYRGLFERFGWRRASSVFLLRRAARIYPLYAAVTVALLALILRHAGPGFDWGGVPLLVLLNMTLLEAWGFGVPIVGPSWSISTEFGAYLLFPVLALIGLSGRPWKAVVLTLLGVTGVVIVASLPTPDHLTGARQGPLDVFWDGTPWQLVRCVAEFSLGLVAYRVWPALRGFCQSSIVGLLVAALVLGLLLLPGTDIALALLTPLLILTLASGHTPVVAALASPPMLWLGRLSYAIYLLHTPMISPVMREGGRLAGRLVAPEWVPAFTELFFVAVVLAAANMCFLVIEKPGRTVIRRLEAFWFPREQAAR